MQPNTGVKTDVTGLHMSTNVPLLHLKSKRRKKKRETKSFKKLHAKFRLLDFRENSFSELVAS